MRKPCPYKKRCKEAEEDCYEETLCDLKDNYKKPKKPLDIKLEIQEIEEDLSYLKEQYKYFGEVVRSLAQQKQLKYKELLESIK